MATRRRSWAADLPERVQRLLYATSVAALFAATVSLAPPALQAQAIDTLALRAHTRFLADDLLRGRGTGSEGERLAAAYIASQLIALGAEGLGPDGSHLLPVPLRAATILPSSKLVLDDGTASRAFEYGGRNFIVNTGGANAFRDFSGDVLFAGAPAAALPLLRSAADVRGAVVAFNGPLGGDAVGIVPLLIERGAAGVMILITDPAQMDLYVRSRGETRFFAAADVSDPVWQPDLPVLLVGPGILPTLARNAPAAASAPLTALVPLGVKATATVRAEFRDVPVANVGGIIRGADPALRDELIVYTAHYDHLGVSTPDERGDSIYNGFSDNAAGVAMLLAIAKAVRAQPFPRSAVFLFFTGEERGLLGSSYAAAHPPFPLSRVRALINLDAGAPPAPPVSWRIAGGVESAALGALAVDVAKVRGWTATPSAASPNSDYWPFLSRKVPSVFIIPGDQWERTTIAERDALRARWDRYHQAGDGWNAAFPFSGLERYAAYALALGRAAAPR